MMRHLHYTQTVVPECDGGAISGDKLFMSCQMSYFYLRTLFQSFGDFYIDEMHNAASLVLWCLICMHTGMYARMCVCERETEKERRVSFCVQVCMHVWWLRVYDIP